MRITHLLGGCAAVGVIAALAVAPRVTAGPPERTEPPSPTAALPVAQPAGTEITVYRSASCGCCKSWEDHLRANGFTIKDVVQEDLSVIKAESGVTGKLASCHTALVAGYVIEGHVPAADIRRLLQVKPKIIGLTAPGMPGGAPGMDTSKDPYDVLTFDGKGNTTVWARH